MGHAAIAALAAAAALAPLPQTFTDPGGDAGRAPDVTALTVAEPSPGVVELEYAVTGMRASTGVLAYLDTDRNDRTGSFSGSEYSVEAGLDAAGARWWRVARWQGGGWTAVEQPAGAGLTVDGERWRIRAAIPGVADFGLYALSELLGGGGTVLALDYVPDKGGLVYEAKTPPAAAPAAAPTVGKGTLRRSGARATVAFAVTDTKTAACSVRLAGRALGHRASLAAGRATCTFTLPRTAKGRTATVTMVVRGDGGTARRTATFRIS